MNKLFTRKSAIIATTLISSMVLTAGVAFAQSSHQNMSLSINNSGSAHLTGKVTAISGSTISVTSWAGTWSVDASSAIFVSPSASLSDIKISDEVKVSGTITSGMSIKAKTIKDI